MTIQEAIRSGKRFYRKNTEGYGISYSPDYISNLKDITLEMEDLLADDWVVQEERVEITEKEFIKFVKKNITGGPPGPGTDMYIKGLWILLKESRTWD